MIKMFLNQFATAVFGFVLVMAAGYFAYECMLYGASVAMLSIPANLIQAVLGAVLGSVIIRGIETLQK